MQATMSELAAWMSTGLLASEPLLLLALGLTFLAVGFGAARRHRMPVRPAPPIKTRHLSRPGPAVPAHQTH